MDAPRKNGFSVFDVNMYAVLFDIVVPSSFYELEGITVYEDSIIFNNHDTSSPSTTQSDYDINQVFID